MLLVMSIQGWYVYGQHRWHIFKCCNKTSCGATRARAQQAQRHAFMTLMGDLGRNRHDTQQPHAAARSATSAHATPEYAFKNWLHRVDTQSQIPPPPTPPATFAVF